MCKLLSEWTPSESAIDLIRFNHISDEQIEKALDYLRQQNELSHIDQVEGYDDWNTFFIMFCIKSSRLA